MDDSINDLMFSLEDALADNDIDLERLRDDPEYRKGKIGESLRTLYNEPSDPQWTLEVIELLIGTVTSFKEQDVRDMVFSYAHALGEKLIPAVGSNPIQDLLNILGGGPGNSKVVEVDLSPVD